MKKINIPFKTLSRIFSAIVLIIFFVSVSVTDLHAQTITTTESRCVNTGEVEITGTVGAGGPYQLSLVTYPAAYTPTGTQLANNLPDTFTALFPGSYVMKVIDRNGAVFNYPFSITSNYVLPDNDDYLPGTTAVTNCAAPDGKIQGVLSNGRAPYSYTIISGPSQVGTTNATGTFTGLSAGNYQIQAADSCQNIQTRDVTITAVSSSFTLSNPVINRISCDSFVLNSLTVTPSFPAGGHYEIQVYHPNGGSSRFYTSSTLPIGFSTFRTDDIARGMVQIRVFDACGNVKSIQPETIANDWSFISANVTQSCSSNSVVLNSVTTTGTITAPYTITVSPTYYNDGGATVPITSPQTITSFPYTITGVNGSTNFYAPVIITDACGTTHNAYIDFQMTLASTVAFSCTGSSIKVTPSTIGGISNSADTYTISPDPNGVGSTTNNTFTNLPDGTYTIEATNPNDCNKKAHVIVKIDRTWKLMTDWTRSDQSCTIGAIDIDIWIPARSSGNVTYTLYNGGLPVAAGATPIDTKIYSDGHNGIISANATDRTPGSDFIEFTAIPPGTYSVIAVDGCGVRDTATFTTLEGHKAMTHNTTIKNKCINKADIYSTYYTDNQVPINVNVYNVNSPSTIINSVGGNNEDTSATNTLVANDLPLGTYIVEYQPVWCGSSFSVYDTVVVAPYVQPKVLTAQSFPPCVGGGNPVIVRASGGVGPYIYEVINSTPSHFTAPPQTKSVFTLPSNQTTVTVRVMDACLNSTTRTVAITKAPVQFIYSSTASFTACTLPLNYSLSIDSLYDGSVYEWTKITGTGAGSTVISNRPSLPLIFNSIADTATYRVRVTVPNTCFEQISQFSVPNVVLTCLPSISGNVFNDANGLTDNTVNGTGTNAGGLNAVLVNSSNQVVATVPVSADGTYNFINVAAGTYSVILSTSAGTVGSAAPTASIPTGWINTGENLGNSTGSDGIVNGTLTNIVVTNTDVTDANFGIEQIPVANYVEAPSQPNPGGAVQLTVPTLNGSDAEDGLYDGISGINTIFITSLPETGTLYYNGIPVQAGDTIYNYNPALLTVDPYDGVHIIMFTYQEIDAASQLSPIAYVAMPLTNSVPLANADISTTGVNTPVTIPVLTNDNFGGDGPSTGTITITQQPHHGTSTVNNGGTPNDPTDDQVVYTPNLNYTGSDTLIYQICDASAEETTVRNGTHNHIASVGDCDTAMVIINIPSVNDVPVANPDYSTTQENTAVTIPVVTNNDTFGNDGPGAVTITITDQPNHGTATVNDGGTPNDPTDDQIVYIPNPNYNGNDTLIYQICDAGGNGSVVDCDTALVIITINPVNNISGNVFNDANGLADNTVNGTGTNVGGQLYVQLVNSSNTVVATTPVAADGTYSFTNVAAGNYSVVINTSATANVAPALPANWVNTGEHIGTTTGSDGAINGILPNIVVTNADITNANFGIEQPPVANNVTAPSQVNPGGTVEVTVPALNGTDVEDGVYNGVSNNNTIVINTLPSTGILYYNGTAVTAGQSIPNYNPSLLTVDPNAGVVTVTFTYSEVDAAGVSSVPAVVIMQFTTLSLSGNVFNDANGLTDNTVNGTVVNGSDIDAIAAGAQQVYVNLLDNGGKVIATTAVAADGSYIFNGLSSGTYSVQLSTNQGTATNSAPATQLPANWVNTGENLGITSGNDGTVNGTLPGIILSTTSVANANFGIEQLPNSVIKTAAYAINTPGVQYAVPGLTGTDAEDGSYADGNTYIITTLPANAVLYYNGVAVTAGQTISNFNTALLTIDPANATLVTSFTYASVDAAGKQDPTPASVTITWSGVLPITLLDFSANKNNTVVALKWTTGQEINSSYMEVQRSADGNSFSPIGSVATANTGTQHNYSLNDMKPLNGSNYYRLKLVSRDGTVQYSNVRLIVFEAFNEINVYPNPFESQLRINFTESWINKQVQVQVIDQLGQVVFNSTIARAQQSETLQLSVLPNGVYTLKLFTTGNPVVTRKIQVKK